MLGCTELLLKPVQGSSQHQCWPATQDLHSPYRLTCYCACLRDLVCHQVSVQALPCQEALHLLEAALRYSKRGSVARCSLPNCAAYSFQPSSSAGQSGVALIVLHAAVDALYQQACLAWPCHRQD